MFDFMILKTEDNKFNAMSRDVEGLGINSSDAFIKGVFSDQFIVFKKRYDSNLVMTKNGDFVEDTSEKGSEIHYFGKYDDVQEEFEGEWKVKLQVNLLGIKIIKITRGKGTWRICYDKPLADENLGR